MLCAVLCSDVSLDESLVALKQCMYSSKYKCRSELNVILLDKKS